MNTTSRLLFLTTTIAPEAPLIEIEKNFDLENKQLKSIKHNEFHTETHQQILPLTTIIAIFDDKNSATKAIPFEQQSQHVPFQNVKQNSEVIESIPPPTKTVPEAHTLPPFTTHSSLPIAQPDSNLSLSAVQPGSSLPQSLPVSAAQPDSSLSVSAEQPGLSLPQSLPVSAAQPGSSLLQSSPGSAERPDLSLPQSLSASATLPGSSLSVSAAQPGSGLPQSLLVSAAQPGSSLSVSAEQPSLSLPQSLLVNAAQPGLSLPVSAAQPGSGLPISAAQPGSSLSVSAEQPGLSLPQ
ncbi:unnamed protein product, partial [Wuchereria bancrofti]